MEHLRDFSCFVFRAPHFLSPSAHPRPPPARQRVWEPPRDVSTCPGQPGTQMRVMEAVRAEAKAAPCSGEHGFVPHHTEKTPVFPSKVGCPGLHRDSCTPPASEILPQPLRSSPRSPMSSREGRLVHSSTGGEVRYPAQPLPGVRTLC